MYKLYTASDRLLKNKELIEKCLYDEEKQLFGFKEIISLLISRKFLEHK